MDYEWVAGPTPDTAPDLYEAYLRDRTEELREGLVTGKLGTDRILCAH
jgi:hypothetical protein